MRYASQGELTDGAGVRAELLVLRDILFPFAERPTSRVGDPDPRSILETWHLEDELVVERQDVRAF